MLNIDELKFDSNGLIPAVVVDSITKKVLTVAYMNRESLEVSMEKGLTCFFSRSRRELWLKGARTSQQCLAAIRRVFRFLFEVRSMALDSHFPFGKNTPKK